MPIDFTKDLEAKIRASFLIMLHACVETQSYDETFFNGIREKALNIASDITKETDLDDTRESIVKALRTLHTLKMYFNLTDEWAGYNAMYELANDSDMEPFEGDYLFNEHLEILMNKSKDKSIDLDDLSEWMSLIPLRMTTAKYYDYITGAVNLFPFQIGTKHIEEFKRMFNPAACLKEEEWLLDIKTILDSVWESEKGLAENNKAISEANEKLVKLTAYVSALFDALCAAAIVQQAAVHGINLLDQPETAGLYEAYKAEVQKKEAGEDFINRLDKATGAMMSEIDYDRLEKPDTVSFDAKTKEMYDKWLPIHNLFYETGFDHFKLFPDSDEPEESDIPAFLTGLKDFMEKSTEGLINKRKKLLRQHFLQYMPYPYDVKDYRQYFLNTYDGLDIVNRRLLSYVILADGKDS